ncbi:MAG: MBL fold metallo-hydrolase [Vicinamibacterales bacterium]|jgi:phosphoribosyl 1,2-cyclic phosphate phosphodiesterase
MPAARVTFLGTGTSHGVPMIGCGCAVCRSADARDRRLRPSILIAVQDGPAVLVDTATDLRQQALTFGITRVDAVIFTHAHADHVMGMDELRRFNVMNGRRLPMYANARTAAEIRRIFSYAFAPPSVPGGGVPDLSLAEIDGPFDVLGLRVEPVPVMHGPQEILGFRVGRFAYLTDCNAIPDASLARLQGLDVLVLDALRRRPHPTHFSLDEAVAMAARLGARQTYFTHICHDLPHAATNAALPATMALAYDGQVVDLDDVPWSAAGVPHEGRA